MSHVRMNIGAALLALALAVTGALLGCGGAHLGDDSGQAYDRALAAQRAAKDEGAGLDADDARAVLKVHRNGPQKGDGSATTTTAVVPVSGASSSSGAMDPGGSWPGAEGNITLEAK